MNSKKVNWLFLTIILCHLAAVLFLILSDGGFSLNIAANLIFSELILAVPAAFFLFLTEGSLKEKLGLCRIKLSTACMVVLFTFLTMPLTTMINAISQLFVDNAVMGISGDVVGMPFPVMFFLMAVYGPCCEEFVFRGLIYRGYRKGGAALGAVLLSGLLFGLMHMNFNQAAYAAVIGILLALLVEASGSIWSSVLYHIIFNGQSVCLLFLINRFLPGMLEQSSMLLEDRDMLLESIGVYMIIASVTTALAFGTLIWIAGNEGRMESFREIWRRGKGARPRLATVPLVLAVILCAGYMILNELPV